MNLERELYVFEVAKLMYAVNAKQAPPNILDLFCRTSSIHRYSTHLGRPCQNRDYRRNYGILSVLLVSESHKRRSSVDTGYPVVKSTGTPTAPLDVDFQDSPSRVPCSLAPCVPNLMICNLRSLAPKVDELECVMEFNDVDIACITETWLTNEIPDSNVSLKDFTLFRKDPPSHGGGLVAYIRSSIPCVLLPKLELRSAISETMWLHVKPFRLPMSVSSRPYRSHLPSSSCIIGR